MDARFVYILQNPVLTYFCSLLHHFGFTDIFELISVLHD